MLMFEDHRKAGVEGEGRAEENIGENEEREPARTSSGGFVDHGRDL